VGFANARVDGPIVEHVEPLQRNPFGACEVRRRDDPVVFLQLDELLGGALERDAMAGVRVERGDREHAPADLEHQVVAPLNVLGRAGHREAQLPEAFDVHGPKILTAFASNLPALILM
jgi:hypothetical protein